MDFSADELFEQLSLLDETLAAVRQHAGSGENPGLQRQMQRHARALRMMLGPDVAALAADLVESATHVLEAADPKAPILSMTLQRDTVAAIVRRQAASASFPPVSAFDAVMALR
jgi:hypothetical protein